MLFYLAGHSEATVGDITRALNASPAGTSTLLSRMETAGLITRTTDQRDRRSLRVTLSPVGREALTEAQAALSELNEHLTHGFDGAELAVVQRWLEHAAAFDEQGDGQTDDTRSAAAG